jgi:hypothetical protein
MVDADSMETSSPGDAVTLGPLLSSSGRVAVGLVTARQVDGGSLSPVADRPFLLRFLEPIKAAKHDKTGATPPETTNPNAT